MEIDESIVDITDVMAEILGFVEDVEYTKDKLMRLETTIVYIMKEIGDCISFVREYLQSSFVGKYHIYFAARLRFSTSLYQHGWPRCPFPTNQKK